MGTSKEAIDRIFDPSNPLGFSVGRITKHIEDTHSVFNCLGVCSAYQCFGALNLKLLTDIYLAVTGIRVTPEELKKRGERVWNMLKVLNVREGFSRKDDKVPEKWLMPKKTPEGITRLMDYYGKRVFNRNDVHKIFDEYYDERGWELDRGVPTKEKLKELGLEDCAEDLEKMGLCRPLIY